jgi:acyl-CoA thioesterase-1
MSHRHQMKSTSTALQRRTLLAGCCAVVLLAGCKKAVKLAAIQPGQTVLAFGDSVTFGIGASRDEDWPSLLAQKTGWNVVNAGVSGDTAQNGKNRIQALLNAHRPALVIIEIGGNDFLRRQPSSAVKENIRLMIKAARQSGAQVALVAVPELSLLGLVAGKPSDSPIYEELADEEKVSLVPEVFSQTLARSELCADRIHPNALGYRFMAEGIHVRLQALGLVK